MKIALVHDYLIQDGGAERVLQAFAEIWPQAPIFTLFRDRDISGSPWQDRDVRTTFLQRFPFSRRRFKWLLPLMPMATEHHDLSEFDVVLSSTSAFAKGVLTPSDALHLCYCHTPTRYLWSDAHSYLSELGLPAPARGIVHPLLSRLRQWDRMAADRVDRFIANSDTVAGRIRKYYRRESQVIHPPVDTASFRIAPSIGNYYLAGGRLVAYKRFDVVVRAFTKLGIPLKIFGEGPESARLRREAGRNIEFLGRVSDHEKTELYGRAIAYLHPQEEDFGITAVEAMAAGRPVIAYGRGGATETVKDGVTGVFLEEQSWEELANRVIRFAPEKFDPRRIREHALRFDTLVFKKKIVEYVTEAHENRKSGGVGRGEVAERSNIRFFTTAPLHRFPTR